MIRSKPFTVHLKPDYMKSYLSIKLCQKQKDDKKNNLNSTAQVQIKMNKAAITCRGKCFETGGWMK